MNIWIPAFAGMTAVLDYFLLDHCLFVKVCIIIIFRLCRCIKMLTKCSERPHLNPPLLGEKNRIKGTL